MSEIQSLAIRVQAVSRSVDWWNTAMIWGLALAAIAAVFVVICTRVVVTRTGELSTAQDLLSEAKDRERDVKIAEAQRGATDADAKAEGFRLGIAKAGESAAQANARAAEAQKSLALAEQHAAEANAKAEGFRREIAKANESSATAEARAAEANLELAKIQERMADRKLTDAQLKQISAAIRPSAGQEFDMTPYWDLPESLALANRIADALIAGGWKYSPPEKSGFMLGGISGVQVWTHPTADDKVRRAAESLLAVLNREGIVSVARTQNPANPPDSKLHLNIGSKP